MAGQIWVEASVSFRKQGEDLVFTAQMFGPFSVLGDAEHCVLNLAARPNVVNAMVINREYISGQPGVRCLADDCHGALLEDGLGEMKCGHCERRYVIQGRP